MWDEARAREGESGGSGGINRVRFSREGRGQNKMDINFMKINK
jgi:hypothetical protein